MEKPLVQLHVEDGWGEATPKSYWIITPDWFRSNKATITEVVGTKKRTTREVKNYPFVTMTLSSDLSREDSNYGYLMAGEVERSIKKTSGYQTTHLAFVSRPKTSPLSSEESSSSSTSSTSNSDKKRIFTMATNYFKNLFKNYARL
ncbi:unnamed protein product [Lepeophtheirus salmonis]|uniref:(salmon louse) hypothetical protein n=1 Tax=Lepeophtheirus salmonis TaxID=72036 RepID=A0A7R8H194_LEPSM|nr:unnamed protein product [Lepeophtheirus salmonis]CAF2807325.1 unnamed protein product [Lepeophtheirus salmonis]